MQTFCIWDIQREFCKQNSVCLFSKFEGTLPVARKKTSIYVTLFLSQSSLIFSFYYKALWNNTSVFVDSKSTGFTSSLWSCMNMLVVYMTLNSCEGTLLFLREYYIE